MKRCAGLTLIELMLALLVLAILLVVAVPGFQAITQNSRSAALANELVAALNLARNEAIRRGLPVTVCSSNDRVTCGATWVAGWVVQVQDNAVEANRTILRAWDTPKGNAVITQDGVDAGTVTFGALGNLTTAATELRSHFAKCKGEQVRVVNVSASGRIAVTHDSCP